ncbi:hypothetical protein LZ554_000661 [Drepanopeziza brunnea f. sp. 'monogermtubi']|nr:hypothetical protein LZ554_000661 [Drepanopeziza brunnea f. sp. 'monogermtubi']
MAPVHPLELFAPPGETAASSSSSSEGSDLSDIGDLIITPKVSPSFMGIEKSGVSSSSTHSDRAPARKSARVVNQSARARDEVIESKATKATKATKASKPVFHPALAHRKLGNKSHEAEVQEPSSLTTPKHTSKSSNTHPKMAAPRKMSDPISISSDSDSDTPLKAPSKSAAKKPSSKRDAASVSSNQEKPSFKKPKLASKSPALKDTVYEEPPTVSDRLGMSAMTLSSALKRGGDGTATKLAGVLNKKISREVVAPRSIQDILERTPTPPPAPIYSPEELKDRNEITTLYFAYGKNLTERYMTKKFPDCTLQLVALAYVRDYKYTLNSAGYVKAVRTEWKIEDKDPGLYGLLWRIPNFVRRSLEAKFAKHNMKLVEVPDVQAMERDPNYMAGNWNTPLVNLAGPLPAWMGVGEFHEDDPKGIKLIKRHRWKFMNLNRALIELRSRAVPSPWVENNVYGPLIGAPQNPFESGYWGLRKPEKQKKAGAAPAPGDV